MKYVIIIINFCFFLIPSIAQERRIFLLEPSAGDKIKTTDMAYSTSDKKVMPRRFRGMKQFVIADERTILLDWIQGKFQYYKKGLYPDSSWKKTVAYYHIDTTTLSKYELPSAINFAIAYKNDSIYYVIDSKQTGLYDKAILANSNSRVFISGIKIKVGDSIYEKRLFASPLLNYPRNKNVPIDSSWFWRMRMVHYKKGIIKIGNQLHDVIVAQQNELFYFKKNKINIYLYPHKAALAHTIENDPAYKIGDTAYVNGHQVIFKQTDTLANFIDVEVKRLHQFVKYGFETGCTIKKQFHFNLYDSAWHRITDLSDKPYILVDFWGSWCAPCIERLPTIKRLSKEYEDKVSVIGVQCEYEGEITAHKKIKDSLGLTDYQIYQHESYPEYTTLIKAVRLTFYPTYIVIDRTGKILFRGNGGFSIEKLEAFLKTLR